MTTSRWCHLAAVALAVVVAGCSRRAPPGEAGADSAATSAPDASLAADVAGDVAPLAGEHPRAIANDTVDAFEGTWDLAAVAQRLSSVGVEARSAGGVRQPFMGVPGTRYLLPGGELQVFLYGDAAARARDTDPLDAGPVTVAASTGAREATLITSNNIAALLVADDDTVRQRVRAALQLAGRERDEP